jgi:hypothetical protein
LNKVEATTKITNQIKALRTGRQQKIGCDLIIYQEKPKAGSNEPFTSQYFYSSFDLR